MENFVRRVEDILGERNEKSEERLGAALDRTLAANRGGEICNLLVTGDAAAREEASEVVRYWALLRGIHLVELSEDEDDWLSEVQSHVLFDKLNQPDTVLLVRQYAMVNFLGVDGNTPHTLLRDAALNRHYGCGNDFVPSDDLAGLLFVVAISDLTQMNLQDDETERF